MKRFSLKISIVALLALSAAACGADADQAGRPSATTAAPATTAASEAADAAQAAAQAEESMAAEQGTAAAAGSAPATTWAASEALTSEEEERERRWKEPVIKEFPLVFYEGYGVNPQIPADEQPFSTFGLDADTASWYRQFAYLDQGARPNPEAIRAEEMINAFDARCEDSVSDGTIRMCVQGSENPFYRSDEYRLVRVAVETGRGFDQPVSYIVVLDQSGSMNDGDRWNVATNLVESLLDNLNPDDRFGLVTFNVRAHVIVEPTYPERASRAYRDSRIRPGSSTNAGEGLRLGYELAYVEARSDPNRQVMVLLVSDGVANTGPATGPDSILELVDRAKRDLDIGMAAAGVGEGNYNDVLLEQIADQAQGWYQYIYDYRSSDDFLDRALAGIVGWEAKTQVEFNPDTVDLWRLIGYENRRIDAELFREDELVEHRSAPLLGGVATAAFFEVKLTDRAGRNDWLASATIRYRPCLDCYFNEVNTRLPVGETDMRFSRSSCDFRLQSYVMQYAEFARNSFYAWDRSTPDALLDAIYRDMDSLDRDERGSCEDNMETVAQTVRRYIRADPLDTNR